MKKLSVEQLDKLIDEFSDEVWRSGDLCFTARTCCGASEVSPEKVLGVLDKAFTNARDYIKPTLEPKTLEAAKDLWANICEELFSGDEGTVIIIAYVAKAEPNIQPLPLGESLVDRFNAKLAPKGERSRIDAGSAAYVNRAYHDAVDLLRFLGFNPVAQGIIPNPNSDNYIELWALLPKA